MLSIGCLIKKELEQKAYGQLRVSTTLKKSNVTENCHCDEDSHHGSISRKQY